MQRREWLAVLLSISVLASCQSPTPLAPTMTAPPAATTTSRPPTSTPTLPPSAAATVTLTPRPSATLPPTPTPSEWLTVNCLAIQRANMDQPALATGSLVLLSEGGTDAWVLDLSTGLTRTLVLPNERIAGGVVSPDGRRLAAKRETYEEGLNSLRIWEQELVVLDAAGNLQADYPWTFSPDAWMTIVAWLDNERVVISATDEFSADRMSLLSYKLIILNVDTGVQEAIFTDLPNRYSDQSNVDWDDWGNLAYEPDMGHVLYLHEQALGGPYAYTLWDAARQQPLATLAVNDVSRAPRWAPDGRRAVVAAQYNTNNYNNEVYLFDSVADTVQQVTHLADDYSYFDVGGLRWSPDGRLVAFSMLLNDYVGPGDYFYDWVGRHLAVMDPTTGHVTDYCVPGADFLWRGQEHAPLWSPDGRYLVVDNYHGLSQQVQLVLVDTVQGIAIEVPCIYDMTVAGWLAP